MIRNNCKSCILHKFILAVVVVFSQTSYAQSWFDNEYSKIEPIDFIATYSLQYMMDTTKPENKRKAEMLLFLGNNVSLFMDREYYISDTITRKFKSTADLQAHLLDRNQPYPKFLYRIYKNYPKGKITFTRHTLDGTFKYEENLNLINWSLTNNSDTINGYKVQQATCDFGGRSWIAWFSPEIPFNDGPYKFNGLPGLILKIYDTQNDYVFEFVSIFKPDKEIIIDIEEKDYIESTKLEFFKAQDDFRDDIISRVKEKGLTSSKSQQAAAKNMAKKNNPIELIRK